MKQAPIFSSTNVRNKISLFVAAGFAVSLLLSMTIIGLAVKSVLHN